MNILVFSWRDPKHPKSGGAEQVMHEHMKAWALAGHNVILFSSKINGLASSEIFEGIEIIRDGHQYLGVQLAGFLYYLKNKENFDLVIDQFHGIPFFTPIYVRRKKLAIIQEVAKNVWFLNPLKWPLNWIVGLIGFLVEPVVFLLYKNTKFMTGSLSAKIDVIKMGISERNITIIPHGVITIDHKFKKLKKEKNKVIIFLGVLSKDKGIEDAVKCFNILSKKSSELNFWIIGRPETQEFGNKISQLVGSLKLTKKVKFWGYISDQKKFELLSNGFCLINPSVHEGWGLVNIEANSVGLPVIAYKVPGSIDSINQDISGLLCNKNTPEGLAEKVLELLENPSKYQKLQKGALRWSSKFSWKKSKALSLKLLKSI